MVIGMADCKACGAWFSSTAPSELCPTCGRALKRLNGYAVHVVRCKGCRYWRDDILRDDDDGEMKCCSIGMYMTKGDDFCSFGKRREGE